MDCLRPMSLMLLEYVTPKHLVISCKSACETFSRLTRQYHCHSEFLFQKFIIFLGGGVPPGPENPNPISNQNKRFYDFRPDSQNVYPISDPVMCGKFGNSQ